MSGKKNKKLQKAAKMRAKWATAGPGPASEDHTVPADVAARLLDQVPPDLQDGTGLIQYDPSLQVKPMSAVLLDVIDPWVQVADREGKDSPKYIPYFNFLCTLATFAWSVKSIRDDAARLDAMNDIMEFISKHFAKDEAGLQMCTATVLGMLERAEDLYPQDERVITSFEIVEESHGPKLYVASALPPSSVPESVRAGLASGRLKQIAPDPAAECPTARIIELDTPASRASGSCPDPQTEPPPSDRK